MAKEHVALTKCYFCQEDHQILLARRYNARGEPLKDLAPLHGKVIDMSPCTKCEGCMKQGVLLITIDNDKSDKNWYTQEMPNPWRTGGWFVVTDDAIRSMFSPPELVEKIIKCRWTFIDHEAAVQLGLFDAANKE